MDFRKLIGVIPALVTLACLSLAASCKSPAPEIGKPDAQQQASLQPAQDHELVIDIRDVTDQRVTALRLVTAEAAPPPSAPTDLTTPVLRTVTQQGGWPAHVLGNGSLVYEVEGGGFQVFKPGCYYVLLASPQGPLITDLHGYRLTALFASLAIGSPDHVAFLAQAPGAGALCVNDAGIITVLSNDSLLGHEPHHLTALIQYLDLRGLKASPTGLALGNKNKNKKGNNPPADQSDQPQEATTQQRQLPSNPLTRLQERATNILDEIVPRRRRANQQAFLEANGHRAISNQIEIEALNDPGPSSSGLPQGFVKHELRGRGAFGKVFRVSFKAQKPDGSSLPIDLAAKFINDKDNEAADREKAMAAKMPNAKHVIKYYGSKSVPGGGQVLFFELVEHNILTLIVSLTKDRQDRAARLIPQIFAGLATIHDQNVAHRDIKAENIGIVGDEVRILDFGSAKEFNEEEAGKVTFGGTTLGYQSPEFLAAISPIKDGNFEVLRTALQARLQNEGYDVTSEYDARSHDLFAAGLVGLEMMLGNEFASFYRGLTGKNYTPENAQLNYDAWQEFVDTGFKSSYSYQTADSKNQKRYNLLIQQLSPNPNKRLSAHKFVEEWNKQEASFAKP